jgi:hypothetical protein
MPEVSCAPRLHLWAQHIQIAVAPRLLLLPGHMAVVLSCRLTYVCALRDAMAENRIASLVLVHYIVWLLNARLLIFLRFIIVQKVCDCAYELRLTIS